MKPMFLQTMLKEHVSSGNVFYRLFYPLVGNINKYESGSLFFYTEFLYQNSDSSTMIIPGNQLY